MQEPLYFCPTYRLYTRHQRHGAAVLCDHAYVGDLLTAAEVGWDELDGELYRARWDTGDRPAAPPYWAGGQPPA